MLILRDTYFWQGTKASFGVPGLSLFASFFAYGALVNDAGLDIGFVVFTSMGIYALPGQLVMLNSIVADIGLIMTMFAVFLSSARLMVLAVTLIPPMRYEKEMIGQDGQVESKTSMHIGNWRYLLVHYIAITSWLEMQRNFDTVPLEGRARFYLGLGSGLLIIATINGVLGFYLSQFMSISIIQLFILILPAYYTMTLVGGILHLSDFFAVVTGFILGAVFYTILPGWELLFASLGGGSIAMGIRKLRQKEDHKVS